MFKCGEYRGSFSQTDIFCIFDEIDQFLSTDKLMSYQNENSSTSKINYFYHFVEKINANFHHWQKIAGTKKFITLEIMK